VLVDEALIRPLIVDDEGVQPVAHGHAGLASSMLYVVQFRLDGRDVSRGRG
jgi:hypothetical protein